VTDPDPTASRPDPYASAPNPYSRETPAAALRAPEGTDPYTLWIWLILAIPVVQTLPLFFIDWSSFIDASLGDPTGLGVYAALFSPAYIALIVFGWVGTGLMFWFAYLDWRELQQRGVPQPFHWAWIFLTLAVSYAVYTIGRSVVVKRRTGHGSAPMWITIATIVASFAIGAWIVVVIFQTIFDAVGSIPLAP
jgi:hypothetical protein